MNRIHGSTKRVSQKIPCRPGGYGISLIFFIRNFGIWVRVLRIEELHNIVLVYIYLKIY